jgi:anti-anti-sigma factor
MILNRRRAGTVTVVDLEGGLDAGSDLVELVETILGEGDRRILLNLRGHSVDSNALGQATRCWLKINREGGVLKIATRQPKVWDLIRMLRLDRVIDCFRNEEEALASFET